MNYRFQRLEQQYQALPFPLIYAMCMYTLSGFILVPYFRYQRNYNTKNDIIDFDEIDFFNQQQVQEKEQEQEEEVEVEEANKEEKDTAEEEVEVVEQDQQEQRRRQ